MILLLLGSLSRVVAWKDVMKCLLAWYGDSRWVRCRNPWMISSLRYCAVLRAGLSRYMSAARTTTAARPGLDHLYTSPVGCSIDSMCLVASSSPVVRVKCAWVMVWWVTGTGRGCWGVFRWMLALGCAGVGPGLVFSGPCVESAVLGGSPVVVGGWFSGVFACICAAAILLAVVLVWASTRIRHGLQTLSSPGQGSLHDWHLLSLFMACGCATSFWHGVHHVGVFWVRGSGVLQQHVCAALCHLRRWPLWSSAASMMVVWLG